MRLETRLRSYRYRYLDLAFEYHRILKGLHELQRSPLGRRRLSMKERQAYNAAGPRLRQSPPNKADKMRASLLPFEQSQQRIRDY